MRPSTGRAAPSAALLLTAAAACWGVSIVASKVLLDRLSPLVLFAGQLVGSVAFLAIAVAVTGVRLPRGRPFWGAAASGLLEPGMAYTVGLVGLGLTSASNAAIIGATETPMILGIAWLFLGERAGWRTLLPAVLAGLGVALLVLPELQTSGGGGVAGDGLMLLSTLLAAVYVTVSRRLVADTAPLPLAAVQQAAGLVWGLAVLAVGRVAGWRAASFGEGSALPLLAAAGVGVAQYALSFWLYLSGLRRVQASGAAVYLALIPVFGLGTAALVLHERLLPAQWLGAAVVVGAVVALSRRGGGHASPAAGRTP